MLTPTNGDTSELTTSLNAILKGNGSGIVGAVAGTDYAGLASTNTYTGVNTFTDSAVIAPVSGSGIGVGLTNTAVTSGTSLLRVYPVAGTNVSSAVQIIPKGTVASNFPVSLSIFATDIVADVSNYSVVSFGINVTSGRAIMTSSSSGTGTLYPIEITTGTYVDQLHLTTTGPIGVGGIPNSAVQFHVTTGAFSGTSDTMTYSGFILMDVTKGNVHITTTSGAGNATINASAGGVAGQEITIIINNDSGAARTITFGSNLSANGTLVGTASKTATIRFASNGTKFYETSRTLLLTT